MTHLTAAVQAGLPVDMQRMDIPPAVVEVWTLSHFLVCSTVTNLTTLCQEIITAARKLGEVSPFLPVKTLKEVSL